MTLSGIPSTLLPVHVKSLPDELLSSWLIRLAHAHGQKLQSFSAKLFGRDKAIWNRDIDKLAPDWLITRLSEVTASPIRTVLHTSLRAYEGVLYEHHQPNGNTRWILPLGIYHRTYRNHGLLYCPRCLTEDAAPYFRRKWRLAFSTVCTKHRINLLDRCSQCNSPVAPHRSDMQSKEYFPVNNQLVYCWKCGHDLRLSSVECVTDRSLLRFQNRLERAIARGYTNWAGNPSMFSVVFFDGFRAFIAGVTSAQSIERMAQFKEQPELCDLRFSRSGFEFAPINCRRVFIQWAAKILHNWPKNFEQLIRAEKLRYADLSGDSSSRPFWYETVIWNCVGGGYAPISKEEVMAITNATERQGGKFGVDKARKLSGRDLTCHVPKRVPVSDAVYQDLMASIDHQIAGTLDKVARACLIRDKVMFATGRLLGLSEGDLADLTLVRLREIVPNKAKLDFTDAARTPAQVRAWVEWYWKEMRPILHPQPTSPQIFISSRTGRGFRHSAIGSRFLKIVDAAMLRSSIPSFSYLLKSQGKSEHKK